MTNAIARRPLTDILLSTIGTATSRPVGDGIAPSTGGWQGQPNSAGTNFVPYNVLVPQTANSSAGPFDDPQGDWRMPYSITSFGVRRDQCEAIADLARKTLSEMRGQLLQLGDQKYSVQQVRTESIGAVTRYDTTDPAFWGQVDVVTVWLSREVS